MPKKYSPEIKTRAIQRYKKGESLKALSAELHISQSTLYQWRNRYCTTQTEARTYTPLEFDAILRRLRKSEHQLEIIRLSEYLKVIPLQKKLATLEMFYHRPENTYSVHELCEALEVDRGTFYNHIFRRADRSKYENEQAELMRKVKQVFDDSEQRFGAEKIRITLAQSGIRISKKRILNMMQEMGLYSIRVDARKVYKKQQKRRKQNLLERNFTAERPNQIWVSDITYFKVNDYWVYLCVILDLYSRKVVGHRVSRNMSTNLATATFKKAYEDRERPRNLTFHSDRGSQYASGAFVELLERCSVKQSFSATGRLLDNAVAETFFATFKREEAYRREYTSEKHFRKCTDSYIQFYNEIRPHQTLNYETPQAFEERYRKRYIEKSCSCGALE